MIRIRFGPIDIRFHSVDSVNAFSLVHSRQRWTRSTTSAKRLGFSMPKHTLTGNIKRHRAFPSKILGNRRNVLVYLPRGYRRFSRKRYPVLYLHDGQNVFDAATSFASVEWGVDETAERLIQKELIEPLSIVAIANTGKDSSHEYAPSPS